MIKTIWKILKAIGKGIKRRIRLQNIVLGVNLIVAVTMVFLFASLVKVVVDLDSKIDIYHSYLIANVNILTTTLVKVGDLTIDNDLQQIKLTTGILDIIKGVQDNIFILKKTLKKLQGKVEISKTIDFKNSAEIRKANFAIANTTAVVTGSGSHIKIGNKSYILTCAHLTKTIDDNLWAITKKGTWLVLDLVKIDYDDDLALFRIKKVMKNHPALEISDEFPEPGSEVIAVGNPDVLEDVLTDGIIAKIRKKSYIFTNKIYFGNSGGALLYKGKLVGVVSAGYVNWDFPVFVNYGEGANLKTVKRFLEEFYE